MCHPQPEKKWRKIAQDFLFGVKNESKDIVMIDIEGPSNDVKGITILTITQHVYTMCSLVKRKKEKFPVNTVVCSLTNAKSWIK